MRPPFLRRSPSPTLAGAAYDWMMEQRSVPPPELPDLLARARRWLAYRFPSAAPAAIDAAALEAWVAIEADRTRCRVDLSASTPHIVVLVDEVAGVRRAIPVADLVRLLGPRAAV